MCLCQSVELELENIILLLFQVALVVNWIRGTLTKWVKY